MSKLSPTEINKLNKSTPADRIVATGTKLNNALSKVGVAFEAVAGKVNTNYAVIDNCDAKNMSTESDNTIFKNTLTTSRFFKGTGCNKLESLTTAAALTHTVLKTGVGGVNWSGSDKFGMWVFSDVALAEGDVQFVINATTGGLQYIDLPAISPGIPTWIELAKGAVTCADVISYGFRRHAAKKFVLYVDHITRFLAAETVVLSQTPVNRTRSDTYPTVSSVDLVGFVTEEAQHNTPAVAAEDTDYFIGNDTKRVIFMTDQSTKSFFAHYAY